MQECKAFMCEYPRSSVKEVFTKLVGGSREPQDVLPQWNCLNVCLRSHTLIFPSLLASLAQELDSLHWSNVFRTGA